MELNYNIEDFAEEGYVVLELFNNSYLKKFKIDILKELRNIVKNNSITLETFHSFIDDENEKIDIQYKLNTMIWDYQLHIPIIQDNIELYYKLIGKDLDIQVKPYLRIVRPNCNEDNIGFHRDSFYGSLPYEISSFIPLVDLDKKNSLMLEPKSHKKGPIPYTKIRNKEIKKGSIKNQLGFLYEPKVIKKDYKINKVPIPMKFNNILIFGLETIHGQDINMSNITRWSIDIRLKSSFASSNTKQGYYKSLSSSPIIKYANQFYKNNPKEV